MRDAPPVICFRMVYSIPHLVLRAECLVPAALRGIAGRRGFCYTFAMKTNLRNLFLALACAAVVGAAQGASKKIEVMAVYYPHWSVYP